MGRAAIQTALANLIGSALPDARLTGFEGGPGKPDRVLSAGAVALIATNAPEPEIDLNPTTYHFDTDFDLAVMAQTTGQALAMLTAIGAAIIADRTLGSTCEWADADAAGLDEETMTGTDGHIEARCTVTATYATTNPLE